MEGVPGGGLGGMELVDVVLLDVVGPRGEAGKDGKRGSGKVERPRSSAST